MRRLVNLPYNIILISHEDMSKDVTKRTGDKSNRNPSPSEVAVCELNGEYTLKRFEKRDGVGWLIPANPDYPEIKVTEDDDFSIWGTVTYIIHKPHNK